MHLRIAMLWAWWHFHASHTCCNLGRFGPAQVWAGAEDVRTQPNKSVCDNYTIVTKVPELCVNTLLVKKNYINHNK